jgi:hypothetical protein
MDGQVGDTIVVGSKSVNTPERSGVIEEVLAGRPGRFRVRWADGHTSIIAPSSGAARILQGNQTGRRPGR